MAPPDRQERRQQRMRGAGASDVQGSFGFDFAGLATKAPKPALTPTVGKRKRASAHVQPDEDHGDDGLPDELSPERDAEMPPVKRTMTVVATQPVLHQDPDDVLDEPDELSIHLDDHPPNKTPVAGRVSLMALGTSAALSRTSKSTGAPTTPALAYAHPGPSSASGFGPQFQTPSAAQDDDSEDELSPSLTPATAPKIVTRQPSRPRSEQVADEELDELSSLPEQRNQPNQRSPELSARGFARTAGHRDAVLDEQADELSPPSEQRNEPFPEPSLRESAREAVHHRAVLDDEVDELSSPLQHHNQPSPASSARGLTTSARRRRVVLDEEDNPEEVPTTSDGTNIAPVRAGRAKPKAVRQAPETPQLSVHERSVHGLIGRRQADHEHADHEESATEDRNVPQRLSKSKPRNDGPPRKQRRGNGPKQLISVMRIRGFNVRGVTAADVTRTIVEHTLGQKLDRMNGRLRQAPDGATRKLARASINCTIAFKDSVDEKLLDLQDMNDNLNTNLQKRKALKSGNSVLRKAILRLQGQRQEIALEFDEQQAAFAAEKERAGNRMKLSADMFDIQAAVQSGRELARRQGRQDEGPEIPLTMLLDGVGRNVGSVGGGLLAHAKAFNASLEKAAGLLEGRA